MKSLGGKIKNVDNDDNGEIDLTEFQKMVFNIFDKDENGFITQEELKRFSKSHCFALTLVGSTWLKNCIDKEVLNEKEIQDIMAADGDKDSKISYAGMCWSLYSFPAKLYSKTGSQSISRYSLPLYLLVHP